jgi:hypothetical protein
MDYVNIIKHLQEEIRITRALTLAVREETKQLEELIRAGGRTEVSPSKLQVDTWQQEISIYRRDVDAAWELVETVREEMKKRKNKKSFWKRWFG